MKTDFGVAGNLLSIEAESFPANPGVLGGLREPMVGFKQYGDSGEFIRDIVWLSKSDAVKFRDALNEFIEECQ